MSLISIIIPVYNTEKYLNSCVESVAGQTFDNLEIILVDDGSTDNCPAICDEWAHRDSRIRVIHKANGGQGEARNIGIEKSHGDYIGFVDSDDTISPFMYERLYSLIVSENADMVQCAMKKVNQSADEDSHCGKIISPHPPQGTLSFPGEVSQDYHIKTYTPYEAVKTLLSDKIITSTCPSVLIKAEIAEKIPFDTGMINEDVMWIYRALRESSKTIVTDEILYAYYQREGSTMNSEYNEKKFDALKAHRMRSDAMKSDFPDLHPLAERGYAGTCMYHYQWLCRLEDKPEYREFRRRLHGMFLSSDLKAVYSVTDLKYKIWYTAFKLLPSLTCKIRNTLRIGL